MCDTRAASAQATEYHPMFFSCDNPYKEFFCQAITLLNRTWREMEATEEDFDKARHGRLLPGLARTGAARLTERGHRRWWMWCGGRRRPFWSTRGRSSP